MNDGVLSLTGLLIPVRDTKIVKIKNLSASSN
jgi:hypothetical protein